MGRRFTNSYNRIRSEGSRRWNPRVVYTRGLILNNWNDEFRKWSKPGIAQAASPRGRGFARRARAPCAHTPGKASPSSNTRPALSAW